MTMTIHDPGTDSYAEKLRQIAVGCKLSKTKWGVKKTLSKEQKAKASEVFGADSKLLSASKTLIDTTDEKYRAVTAIFSQVTDEWKTRTLPYPEDGVRLIKHEHVAAFEEILSQHQDRLDRAVAALNESYEQLLAAAELHLGDLFNRSDYPLSLDGLFSISVEYPSLEPDAMLNEVSAGLYHRERERIAARFDEAVTMAEQAFTEEFQGLLTKLCERLQGLNDGTVKQFRNSHVTNLKGFFDTFKEMSIGSNEDLERLVGEARNLMDGVKPEWMTESRELRDVLRRRMGEVSSQLSDLMVARPKRAISFDD